MNRKRAHWDDDDGKNAYTQKYRDRDIKKKNL